MKKNATGAFVLVLHAHLPHVLAHGRWPHGTDWLNEAAAETYVPLLSMLREVIGSGRSPKITLGITPVLTEQLADPSFHAEFRSYLDHRIEAARDDQEEFTASDLPRMNRLARYWERFFRTVRKDFRRDFRQNLVGGFSALQKQGQIEIITCAATHGYLPLLGLDSSVRAQIRTGVQTYRRHHGCDPRGIWLPECAYRPRYSWTPPVENIPGIETTERAGVEEILAEEGIRYFIIDAAMLRGGEPIGAYLARFGMLQRLWSQFQGQFNIREEDVTRDPKLLYYVSSGKPTPHPVAVFTRDTETSLQVWSGEIGYPGDPFYLDFHKKRFPGGLRYWRVTDARLDLGAKQEYEPDRVDERIRENAEHFCHLIKTILRQHRDATGRPGVLCSPFDAELFGHWWFEGIRWLREVLIRLADDPEIELTTCSEALERYAPQNILSLPEGSWGEGGYHYIWLNQDTAWTWRLIYTDEARMKKLVEIYRSTTDDLLKRLITQAARELLLLQSSDWQFVISTTHARDYAHVRINNHHQMFTRLADAAEKRFETGNMDAGSMDYLIDSETRDGLFPDLDVNWFSA